MNNQRIGILNRFFALLLSIIAAAALIISQFTFPLELVLLNGQSYSTVIENEELANRYPEIITDVLVSQFYDLQFAGALPEILSNQDAFRSVLESYVPADWANQTMMDFVMQIMDYLNFRIPSNSMNVELAGLKSELILNSREIAQDYVNSLVNCRTPAVSEISSEATAFNLPPCKPDRAQMPIFVELTSIHLEDLFNQLPTRFTATSLTAVENGTTDRFFYSYSITRWALRLMPLLTIGVLILIALLLRKERTLMLRWVGRLLVITSALALIFLVILLIGFDQFIALSVNRFLGNLIEGFDVLLLGFIQEVGYQTLVWVVVSVVLTLGSGLFLILMAKFFKPKPAKLEHEEAVVPDADIPDHTMKEIAPQTMEEIEEEEKVQLDGES